MKTGTDFTEWPFPGRNIPKDRPSHTRYSGRPGMPEGTLPSHRALTAFLESRGKKDATPDEYEPLLLELILARRHTKDASTISQPPVAELRKILYAGIPDKNSAPSNEDIVPRLKQLYATIQDEEMAQLNLMTRNAEDRKDKKAAMEEYLGELGYLITAYQGGLTGNDAERATQIIEDVCIRTWNNYKLFTAVQTRDRSSLDALKRRIAMLQPLRNAFYRRRLFPNMHLPQQRTGT